MVDFQDGDKIAELKDTTNSILKRLKVCELGFLLQALQSRGGDVSSCVFYPCDDRIGKRIIHEPHLIVYRTFRHPGIQSVSELKHLAVCSRHDVTNEKICINPYHYSAVVQIELPAKRSTPVKSKNDTKREESSSGFVSNYTPSTSMEPTVSSMPLSLTEHPRNPKEWPKRSWCCVAYWEHNDRIGPLYHQYQHHNILNIYESLPVSNKAKGMCLAALYGDSIASDTTKRVRNHIGFGLQLSREEDGIWMYNRSDFSLFANGPTLSERTSEFTCRHNTIVHKVPPGYSLKLYDYTESPRTCQSYGDDVKLSVPHSVRVSFAKGWGNTCSTSYRRQFVTSCPCWIEIHFVV
ncbi:mothers against decapentaplegic homolog 6-like isoform X2 [Actinia tenebrosa]|uniref:Mothers against decapentaplegic homolog n=1 Tax=Actinia tenebrosa TaxID=6105 RepID=A0A6P8I5X8_ACTTE|nr:mothers against decapentaplegic homolog 6-like isoform X2 [Actinia tenebrosa]